MPAPTCVRLEAPGSAASSSPIGQRVPRVEVAEQHRDRERQHQRRDGDRPDRHREAPDGRRRPPGGPRPSANPSVAPTPHSTSTTPFGQPRRPASSPGRRAAGTSRTARRRRARRPASIAGSYGVSPASTRRAPSSSRARSKPAFGGLALPQRPADPGDAQPDHEAGHDPRPEAVGAEPAIGGARAIRHGTQPSDRPAPRAERRRPGRSLRAVGRRTPPAASAAGRRGAGDRRTPTARPRVASRTGSGRSASARNASTTTVASHRAGWMANGEMLRNANAPLSHSRRTYAMRRRRLQHELDQAEREQPRHEVQQRAKLPPTDPVDRDQHGQELEAAGDRDAGGRAERSASASRPARPGRR